MLAEEEMLEIRNKKGQRAILPCITADSKTREKEKYSFEERAFMRQA